eukprot:4660009-Pyramimonas_sp.AAC.1
MVASVCLSWSCISSCVCKINLSDAFHWLRSWNLSVEVVDPLGLDGGNVLLGLLRLVVVGWPFHGCVSLDVQIVLQARAIGVLPSESIDPPQFVLAAGDVV